MKRLVSIFFLTLLLVLIEMPLRMGYIPFIEKWINPMQLSALIGSILYFVFIWYALHFSKGKVSDWKLLLVAMIAYILPFLAVIIYAGIDNVSLAIPTLCTQLLSMPFAYFAYTAKQEKVRYLIISLFVLFVVFMTFFFIEKWSAQWLLEHQR